jgi:hypothetical protein
VESRAGRLETAAVSRTRDSTVAAPAYATGYFFRCLQSYEYECILQQGRYYAVDSMDEFL